MCILVSPRTLLKMVLIDLDIQGHLGAKSVIISKKCAFCAITHHYLELGSSNLQQLCIVEPSKALLKMVLIDLDP